MSGRMDRVRGFGIRYRFPGGSRRRAISIKNYPSGKLLSCNILKMAHGNTSVHWLESSGRSVCPYDLCATVQ